MAEPLKHEPQQTILPRTTLGERLRLARERVIASGEPLLSWTEIARELAERRGDVEQRG